jgi:ligand-binding sensor domain-containing protein
MHLLTYTGINASVWTSLTNINTVRSMAYDQTGDELILATWGGVLRYQRNSGKVTVLGRVDGFSSVDIKGVDLDEEGRLIIATADRGLDILFGNGTIRNYTEFDGLPTDNLTFVTSRGGDLWVGTTEGAAQLHLEGELLQPRNLFFAEPWNLEVMDVAFNGDTTSFATNDGLWLSIGASTFQQFTTLNGLLDNNVRCLFGGPGGILFVGTGSGVQRLETDGSFTDMMVGLSGSSLVVNDIVLWEGDLWLATNGGVYSYSESEAAWQSRTDDLGTSKVLSLFVDPDNTLYVGTYRGGLATRGESGWIVRSFPGPSVNFQTNIVVDEKGILWSGTWKAQRSESSLGRYDGTTWVNFTSSNSDLAFDLISSLSVAPDSTIWAGSPWHHRNGTSGLSILDDNSTPDSGDDTWWTFDAMSTGLSGNAIRSNVVFKDRENAMIGSWNQFSEFGFRGGLDHLKDYSVDANFRSFIDYLRNDQVNALALDQQGNLWIGYYEVGLDVFILEPENGTDSLLLEADPDDRYLLSRSINDLKVGPENHLWIASASGVNEIDFSSSPASRSSYQWTSYSRENTNGGLPDLLVRDIEFQGNRFVWFATPSGAGRYDREGRKWDVFNESNSGLLDNRIWDIYVDNARNHVWFATEKGICRYEPLGNITGADISGNITIRPNPFIPSTGHEKIYLGRFTSPASLNIYNISGKKIKTIETEIEWADWDGKDSNGNPVASGVYIVVAKSRDNIVSKGKIAIVR